MAGSRKTVAYVADDGNSYCISVDESNVEMIMGASVPASASHPALPKGVTPRKVRVQDETGLITRVIPVLTQARYNSLTGSTPLTLGAVDSDNGTAVRVRTKTPEKNRFIPRDFDTGRQDGDAN